MMSLLCKMIPTCEIYRVCDKRAQMHAAMRAYIHTYIHTYGHYWIDYAYLLAYSNVHRYINCSKVISQEVALSWRHNCFSAGVSWSGSPSLRGTSASGLLQLILVSRLRFPFCAR